MTEHFDVVVLGAGPAGLTAGLSLVRARRRTLIIDSNRPRNAATLHSHGFLTRDGISPLELRKLGREDFEKYPDSSFHSGLIRTVVPVADLVHERARFAITTKGLRGEPSREITAESVLVATGLAETLPALPSIRAWYGTNLHSCIECDGYEKSGGGLALIGETDDLAERALLISRWTDDLIIFTNAVGTVTEGEEAALAARGIAVDRRPILDIAGEQGAMTGVELQDGTFVARDGGFVRPHWTPAIEYLDLVGLDLDDDGLLVVDELGRTSVPGLYAAGDSTPPGADQLIIAAGSGARVAGTINRDLLGHL
jgi:thioredoxin reductase